MRFPGNLTLAYKIVLLPTLGLLIGVGVFSALGMRAVDRATDSMLVEQLTTARLVADYLDEALGRALNELKDVARNIDPGRPGSYELQLQQLKENYSRLSVQIDSMYLIGARGQTVWYQSGGILPSNGKLSFGSFVDQAVLEGRASVSGLLPTPSTDEPAVFLVAPIGRAPVIQGALVVGVDVAQSRLSGFVQPIRLGTTGYVEVVDEAGIVLARTEPGPKTSDFERSDHSGRFASLIAAGEPTRGLCHTCHETVQRVEARDVLAFVPLQQARWGVAVRQSENEALAPINELRRNLVLVGAGLVLLTLLFVALLARDVTGRIGLLVKASRRISSGDLSTPVVIQQKDEIGVLARNFEEMRVKLNASYGTLERRTRELSSLLYVSETLATLGDLSHLDMALGNALDKVLEIISEESGGIILLDPQTGRPDATISRGKYDIQLKDSLIEHDIVDRVILEPRAQFKSDGSLEVAGFPLSFKEKLIGMLLVARAKPVKFSAEDIRLLEGIAREIAIAVENAHLHREVRLKEQVRGELLQDLFTIQEEEQKRIARELHDETSQVVSSLSANLEAAIQTLPPDAGNTGAILRKSQALSISILDEIHRLIYELRPSLLDDLGLVAAVKSMAENNLKGKGVASKLKVTGRKRRLTPRLEGAIFRLIQEAVNNIARHAQAKSASIMIAFRKDAVLVQIADDGRGFDVRESTNVSMRPRGLGLLGMKERVDLLHGRIEIQSDAVKGGTRIDIEIPLNTGGENG